MKRLLLSIFVAIIFITFTSCTDNEEKENDTDTLMISAEEPVQDDDKERFKPSNTDAGISQLDMLVNSELGWRNIKGYDGKHSFMIFSEDANHSYYLNWTNDEYELTSDGEWITIYDPEDLNSDEFVPGECYALNFISKDTFELCFVHMCARIKDEFWDTYARVKDDDGIVSFNHSTDPGEINKLLEKIDGKYIEVEYKEGIFRKLCTRFKIYKRNAQENETHHNFWFDNVMDGYEYHIENVSYDPMDPDKIIFEGTENYFEEKKSTLTFMLYNKYKVIQVESGKKKFWYMHENDYTGIAEPMEPCDEEEY